QLTDRQKQIIYLRYREQLTFREIALVMDISYQSAKNLMQKTLQKLKEKVGNR
ncbi:MAG: sigma-70 family RNA polymerase sigma factor, partial [Bacteroidales bacterium]|nr:sigma-70 family RNA polymerase sigma factor [Bacteroidales bacterium]